jgi:hypothetical protein
MRIVKGLRGIAVSVGGVRHHWRACTLRRCFSRASAMSGCFGAGAQSATRQLLDLAARQA